ncbi:MAG: SnoaL-like domain-containing protein [Deltaproteobacteria bacterium]|nr:SnoaL-like domain-containing protein [Deltaproteobacteria bacterium]
MDTTLKPIDQPDTGRRSFIWKAGAAVSAVLATALPAMAMPAFKKDKGLKSEVDRLNSRLGTLEDEKSIHALHHTCEALLDRGAYEELVEMFSNDGEVIFNQGVYKGKETGITRLFCGLFRSGMTGKRMSPAPGFETVCASVEDHVQVSSDRMSAKGCFLYSMQIGIPLDSDSVLVQMARLQGGGVMRLWEGGTCHISCVKDKADGSWKIKRLEYQALAQADYRHGKSDAKPVSASLFTKRYPEDPVGPDKIAGPVQV